jgi:hypothetical protein
MPLITPQSSMVANFGEGESIVPAFACVFARTWMQT